MKNVIRTFGLITFVVLLGVFSSSSAYAALDGSATTTSSTSTGFETALNNFDPNIDLNLTDGSITVTLPTPTGTTTHTDTFFFPDDLPIPSTICKLKVIKTVEGGSAQPSDFQIHVRRNGTDIDGSPSAGTPSGTWYETTVPGQYSVSETGPAGYTPYFSGDCSASGTIGLTLGTSATCYIKNVFNGGSTTTPPATTTPPTSTTTPPSTGGGTLGGEVIAPPATATTGGSLSGNVIAPSGGTLTGAVVAPSGGGGGSLSGSVVTPSGGGSLGGNVVTPPGGGSLGGTVIPPTTTPGGSIVDTSVLPGIPNTGEGGEVASVITLVISALITIFGSLALTRMRRV